MKKITSIFLSILLLASSSGIAYAQHFCGDFEMLSKITLGESDLSCEMVVTSTNCNEPNMEAPSCCDNQYTQVTIDDTFVKADFTIQFHTDIVIAEINEFLISQSYNNELQQSVYLKHPPPFLQQDFQVLYETFLI